MIAGPMPASYLFVPATRVDRIQKALRGHADVVIVDLEDGVAHSNKATAREGLRSIAVDGSVHLRINGLESDHFTDDVAAAGSLPWVSAVVVPKVESAADLGTVASMLPPRLKTVALVETARGLVAVDEIASAGAARIMFGSADYLADIGATSSRDVLAYPRSRLVVASRAAGLPAPVDGPSLLIDNPASVRTEAEDAKALGFGAKLCIHPTQVDVVNLVFHHSDEERRWARAVLAAAEASGGGAFSFEGAMVDEPVLIRARQLLGSG